MSAVIMLVRIAGGKQQDVKVAYGEENDTASVANGNDRFAKVSVPLATAACVRRKRENPHGAFQRINEPKKTGVVRRIASYNPLRPARHLSVRPISPATHVITTVGSNDNRSLNLVLGGP